MTGTWLLADMTWAETAQLMSNRPIGLLPIGAIEAHGPHLPLDTDVIIAEATSLRAAQRLHDRGFPAIVLPPLSYSVSFVGTSFPGTTPVDANMFCDYLTNLLTHLGHQGYRAIVCCNAHLEPAHVDAVQRACASAEQACAIPIRSPDQRSPELAARLSDEFRAGARHAGSYETSIVLAAKPDVIRHERLATLDPVWIDLPERLRAGARTFLEAGAQLGYFGDPRSATPEEGHRLLDALAEMVVEICDAAGVTSAP